MKETTHTSTSTLTTNEKIIQLIQGLHQLHTTPMKAAHYQKLALIYPIPLYRKLNNGLDLGPNYWNKRVSSNRSSCPPRII